MFPSEPPNTTMVEPTMEAAGIEPAQDSPGLLYAIQAENGGPVKIGWTTSRETLPGRIRSLQAGNPYPLEVIWTQDGTRRDEAELHWKFRNRRLCREWFDGTADVAAFFGAARVSQQPLAHVYDEGYESGWHRGYDDCNWELEEKGRSAAGLRKSDEYDLAQRAATLTGSPWALRQLYGKKDAA